MADISNKNVKIDKLIYLDMYKRYDAWKKKYGKEPNKIYTKANQQGDYVSLARFKDMQKRFDKYWVQHKVQPNYVWTKFPTTTAYVQAFNDAVGQNVTSFTAGYNAIKGRVYSYYYNDIYSQANALKRLKNRSGLNCTDICQLMYQLAKDLGYSVRYVNIRCVSGSGHIQLDVKGKEFGNTWKRVDPAAALKSSVPLGTLWCANGTVLAYDQAWILSDDGRT